MPPDKSKVQEGVRLLEELKEHRRKDADYWLTLGLGYSQLDRKPQESMAYRRFLQLEPTGQRADDVRAILD